MPALPPLPEGFTARPLTPGDVPAVADLLAAAEAIDDTGEFPDADDITEWWTGWDLEFDRDGLAVLDRDGALAGYATVMASPTFRDDYRVYLEGRVRADARERGLGGQLLAWQQARGAELHGERHPEVPGRLVVEVPGTLPALERLVERAGFAAERWYRSMERPLRELPEPRRVAGVQLVPFDAAWDDEVRRVYNVAFGEHHGSSERDVESWQRLYTGTRSFRPDLSVLAIEAGRVVGFVLASVFEADTEARGYREVHYGQIGVLPSERGRGLASAMIAAALHEAAAHDCAAAALEVDSDNVTGALRLYEGLGFRAVRTRVSWSTALPAAAGG
ncbi:GNAT family N-acetyltransferase [Blastococcus sp. CCUG 61487]|uniref:GNAT family N-acetyltransferase n=1 Tax=Blastococcus sp. CCUG 61487 TaxID=1840703 RepID=UPI0010C05130|nr:GNAT family N-acetyltransferase [Blastococcus sp. CCUG 61487]TKJ18521.1 GCN5 family acetyltransferase [Blastococcus sp. CCUG 61487]